MRNLKHGETILELDEQLNNLIFLPHLKVSDTHMTVVDAKNNKMTKQPAP